MKLLDRITAKRTYLQVSRIIQKPVVTGCVEQFDSGQIAGWVLNRNGGNIELALSINGSTYSLVPEWQERADVSQQYGQQDQNAGFQCKLPHHVMKAMDRALRDAAPISVFANKVPLNILCPLPLVTGFVERFDSGQIAGWVLNRNGGNIELALSINGSTYSLAPEWLERADISQQYGQQDQNAGFQCKLPHHVMKAMDRALRNAAPISVFANEVPLTILCPLPQPLVREPLNIRTGKSPDGKNDIYPHADSLTGEVESWGHFVIHGWVMLQGKAANSVYLLCNGKELDCAVLHMERPDIIQSTAAESMTIGYEIELPGYMWEKVAENEAAEITLMSDGKKLSTEPLTLSRKKTIDWVSEITGMEEGQEKQYMSLLALEHLRYSGLFERLDLCAQRFYHDFAEKMQLDDFVGDMVNGGGIQATKAPAEHANTLILWKAQRELNDRLADNSKTVFEHVKAIQEKMCLTGVVKDSFHHSVIPLLCKHGQFLQMRQLASFGRLYDLDQSGDIWVVSLSLAPLVADAHVARASDVLLQLAKKTSNGWLSTECVYFSVRHLQELESCGEVDLATAERFRYAFISLLDGFYGEWFSRLHDQELVDACICLVAGVSRYTDYHRRDVANAAIRHYGLNPNFWQRLSEYAPDLHDRELAVAKGHWQNLHAVLTNTEHSLAEQLDQLQAPLQYFQEKKNPESIIFLREILANVLPEINKTSEPAGLRLIQRLLDSNPAEALRIAAYPLPGGNRLKGRFPEMQEQLYHTLHEITERPTSVVYELQAEAAACLKRAQSYTIDNKEALVSELQDLKDKATGLGNWQGMFLGADLLAQGLLIADETGMDIDPWLMKIDGVIRKSIDESKAGSYLPATVCTALNHLYKNQSIPFLQAWLQQITSVIESKFGSLYDTLFDEPDKKQLMATESSWPQDTLVVIYSCRKYLDTRVAAIRNGWVKDLNDRGIPYVVLVGDGDDTLQEDVLSLNVSDAYEDLPKKTLRMFEWVYHNTGAQYVLKIDDDCYLDVDEYFDSLSYRRQYYYGRILDRAVGDMDRVWHNAKSQTLRAKKAIDKSPEPSLYADGGGGYCLSRLAIKELIKAEKTDDGQRLIARSFMEDKLVGDLLIMAHIAPSDEDYECYQRRRTFGEAMPVAMWENTFYPSLITPTKVVHLDTHLQQQSANTTKKTNELWPKKIWPTCWLPSIRLNTNQLELLTPLDKFEKLIKGDVFVVSVVRNEMIMLPHFLDHYRRLGSTSFIFVDNCSDDGTREYLHEQPDVILYSSDTEYKYSHYGVVWQQTVLGNLCLNKWVLLVDADEFLVYEDYEQKTLRNLVLEAESSGAFIIRTDMIDMYPGGDLDEADFTKSSPFEAAPWFDKNSTFQWRIGSGQYSNGITHLSGLRHRLVESSEPNSYTTQKYALVKYQPWVRYSQGLHDVANVPVANTKGWLAHFKYHAGFKAKVIAEVKRKQHYNNASEYKQYLNMLIEGKGGMASPGKSIKYENSKSFINNIHSH